jgi:MFS family permease
MVGGQAGLGQLSDWFGRKPLIIGGLLLTASFYAGLTLFTWFPLMLLVALIAGLGTALMSPALSAFYLDITAEQHRSKVLGIKESSAALGGVAGPLAVVAVSAFTTPQRVFMISFILMVAAAGLAFFALRAPHRTAEETEEEIGWELL